MNEIKRLANELKELEAKATAADEAYESDPENKAFEKAADETYAAELAKREELVEAICKIAPIDKATARKMTFGEYGKKLFSLVEVIGMMKADQTILKHLKPMDDYADVYFCFIYKYNKDCFIDSVYDKVKAWVESNGGSIVRMSDKLISGDNKGYKVRIRFPNVTKRDMKSIMATLY